MKEAILELTFTFLLIALSMMTSSSSHRTVEDTASSCFITEQASIKPNSHHLLPFSSDPQQQDWNDAKMQALLCCVHLADASQMLLGDPGEI